MSTSHAAQSQNCCNANLSSYFWKRTYDSTEICPLIAFADETKYVCMIDIEYITGFNPLKPELNPICYFLALLAHHFLHVSRIRVKSLTLR